jgi:hypothetical protein
MQTARDDGKGFCNSPPKINLSHQTKNDGKHKHNGPADFCIFFQLAFIGTGFVFVPVPVVCIAHTGYAAQALGAFLLQQYDDGYAGAYQDEQNA